MDYSRLPSGIEPGGSGPLVVAVGQSRNPDERYAHRQRAGPCSHIRSPVPDRLTLTPTVHSAASSLPSPPRKEFPMYRRCIPIGPLACAAGLFLAASALVWAASCSDWRGYRSVPDARLASLTVGEEHKCCRHAGYTSCKSHAQLQCTAPPVYCIAGQVFPGTCASATCMS